MFETIKSGMTKTFRLCGIFFVSASGLIFARLLFSFLPLSDNVLSWLFSTLFQVVFLGIIPWLLYRYTVSKPFADFQRDFSFHPKVNPVLYALALPIGILTFYLNVGASAVWYTLLNAFGYTYSSSVGTIFSSPEVLIMEIITTCLFPAFFEELTNRGLLSGALRGEKNDTAVILLIGMSFGLWHQNVAQLIPTMVGGLVMAYMAVKCGSIFPGMIVHFLNNFIITRSEYSSQHGGGFYAVYRSVISGLSSSFLVLLISWFVAAGLLAALLFTFERLGRVERDRLYPNRPGLESPKKLFDIFDLSKEEQLPPLAAPAKWEYAFLYVSLAVAALTTLFTFIWGLLR